MSLYKFDHHIQSAIFSKLRLGEIVRYKDLRITDIESSQFIYHLHELIRVGLVYKVERGKYQLTSKGIELAQHFSLSAGGLRLAPPTYSLIFLRSKHGKWAVLQRKKQPHFNKYACISGKVHTGETLEIAATREFRDFTSGLITTSLTYRGYVSVSVSEQGFQTHITGPVWFADNVDEISFPETRHGLLEWHSWKDLPYKDFIPGWKEIVTMIEQSSPAYLDLHFRKS